MHRLKSLYPFTARLHLAVIVPTERRTVSNTRGEALIAGYIKAIDMGIICRYDLSHVMLGVYW